MRPERLDITLGFKAISLSAELSGAEKRVAAAILDSYNHKTTQCDPSFGRIAHLLGISRRTVIRAVQRLEGAKFLLKRRHGGKSHRNSYVPNWVRFREEEAAWSARKKTRHWGSCAVPNLSPSPCEMGHVVSDQSGTQTSRIKSSNETSTAALRFDAPQAHTSVQVSRQADQKRDPWLRANIECGSSAFAALAAAERRWTDRLNRRFAKDPALYAKVLETIDRELQKAATEAELAKSGAGFDLIMERVGQSFWRKSVENESH